MDSLASHPPPSPYTHVPSSGFNQRSLNPKATTFEPASKKASLDPYTCYSWSNGCSMDPEWKCPYAHNHTGTVTRNPVWAGEFQGTPAAHRATATRESTSQRSRNMPSGEIGPVQQTIDLILKDADICQLKENIIAGQSSYIKVGLINTFSIAESIDRSCVNLTALMKEMELMEPASQHAKTLGNEIRKLSEAGEDLQSLTEMFAGAKEDVEDLLKATGLNAQFGAENK